MPSTCVAACCSNEVGGGISLHVFPQDAFYREQWVRQVRRTRVGFTPAERSVLCSAHFEAECFDPVPALKEQLGFGKQKPQLLPTAIPTIFPRGQTPTKSEMPRESRAVEKRARLEIINACMHMATSTSQEEPEQLPPDNDAEMPPETTSSGCQVQPSTRNVAMQFRRKGRTKSVQVDLVTAATKVTMVTVGTQTKESYLRDAYEEDDVSSESSSDSSSDSDSDYDPSTDEMEVEQDPCSPTEQPEPCSVPPKHHVFIIFWSCLSQLMATWCSCPECGSRKVTWECKEVGTLLKVTLRCATCCHTGKWRSQPFYGKTAAGNILLSAAILFSGACATKVLRVLSHMGVAVMCVRSFFHHQRRVLFTAVQRLWREEQAGMMYTLRDDSPIVCGGDGRADSPGHCAKYGTYTLMELEQKRVIDVQLVQSNEAGSSYKMEEVGLRKSLEWVQQTAGVEVGTLVTDCHVSINKMMREEHPTVKHIFDIWHVAKGIKKNLQHLSQRKGCESLKAWIPSIINHLYWSVVSTPDDNRDLALDKWRSVVAHVQNRHQGFEGLFPRCEHPALEGRELQKPWLAPCTMVSIEMEKVVFNPKLCKDIKRLSPAHQTSCLEAFHSLIIHYAPKMYGFSHEGMDCRVKLAALHFNENAGRPQRTRGDGELMNTVCFPKYRKGGYIVRKILEKPSFGYVEKLMTSVIGICRGEGYNGDMLEGLEYFAPVTRPLSADCQRPNKEEAVRAHTTRFRV